MAPLTVRRILLALAAIFFCAFILRSTRSLTSPLDDYETQESAAFSHVSHSLDLNENHFRWAKIAEHYPVSQFRRLPSGRLREIPKIQATFGRQSAAARRLNQNRRAAVKGNFTHAWKGYKSHAWMADEVHPITGSASNVFGGWSATLVDSLDTLWIMGMHEEFDAAVKAVGMIDFSSCTLEKISVFETTIRYLGGLLAAYDLSAAKYPALLEKATELGDMLYKAFDTPNRMPVTYWNLKEAAEGVPQEAGSSVLVAELGSLTLEFTRLSQLTGNPRYYDAVQRIMDIFEAQQMQTNIPGMWPVFVNAKDEDFSRDSTFTIGGMADSLYEYLPKQHLLLGGATKQYEKLYENALAAIKKYLLFRPMTPQNHDILIPGSLRTAGGAHLSKQPPNPEAQHLGCFSGGMVGIGAKIFEKPDDMKVATRLVEGCLWAYEAMPRGIMPEIMHTARCSNVVDCAWNETAWQKAVDTQIFGTESVEQKINNHRLPPGVTKIDDARYILRPEAIESVFILYRITGDTSLQDRAWDMFENIVRSSLTEIAHSGVDDCTTDADTKNNRMESFWLAETLKYFYLIFSDPNLVNLDEYVLNTEAHPLKRPVAD